MSFITSTGGINPPFTAGGVTYGTGSGASVSAAGTTGQVLTSAGTGTPTWTTAATAVSNYTLISTISAVGVSQLSWTGLSGSYTYLIIFNGVFSGFADQTQVRAGTGGVLVTSGYYGQGLKYNSTTVTPYTDSSSGASGLIIYAGGSVADIYGYMYIIQNPTNFRINFNASVGGTSSYAAFINYTKDYSDTITNLQVYNPSRNYNTGSASLYKIST
jgi:hypothetical protein